MPFDIIFMVIIMTIKTVFMGTPEFAVPVFQTLTNLVDVVLTVTQPDKLVGRKKELTPSPIKIASLNSNIPVFQPLKIRTDYETIKNLHPDLIITCAYGQLLPEEILNLPRLGCINVHASLLPKYRGGAPIHRAILNGEDTTGITIMYMDKDLDTGDIISQVEVPILDTDTTASLHDKLSLAGAKLLEETLPSIINKTNPRLKQDNTKATYASIIKREDEHLDFTLTAKAIFNQVRALNSWPLANLLLDNAEIKVINGYIGPSTKGVPGTIVDLKKDAIGIACSDKIYYLTEIKPFGKKKMLVKDYLNGIKKEELLNKQVN